MRELGEPEPVERDLGEDWLPSQAQALRARGSARRFSGQRRDHYGRRPCRCRAHHLTHVTRAAAVCSLLLGIGFGLPGAVGAWYYARHGDVWTFLGFPTYGEGPFERWGVPTSVPLLLGFVAVCAAEVVVGVLLWRDGPVAPWLALALLPVELVFWIGFALPFGPVLGVARTVLVIAALVQQP